MRKFSRNRAAVATATQGVGFFLFCCCVGLAVAKLLFWFCQNFTLPIILGSFGGCLILFLWLYIFIQERRYLTNE